MKSYNSPLGNLINRALFKEQLKRFWVIAALPLLAYILFVLLPLHSFTGYNNDNYMKFRNLINLFRMSNFLLVFTSVAVPLVAALSLYSYLFNPRAATAINAYPVNRKQLFFSNFFAGLALMVVPLLIFAVFLFIPITISGEYTNVGDWRNIVPALWYPRPLEAGDVINTVPVVAAFLGRLLITYTFYFALFTLACVLAGHGVVAFLLCIALPLIPFGLVALDQAVKYWMVAGYSTSNLNEVLGWVLMISNPTGWSMALSNSMSIPAVSVLPYALMRITGVFGNIAAGQLPMVLTYAVTTAALITGAYFLHKIRKQERAGDSVVFNPFKQVLIFLLSLAGGIIMRVFFLNMLEPNTQLVQYGGFALGFALAFFIAQMIAEKTFNVGGKFKTLIKFAVVMAGLYLVVFVSARFDLNGYQRYVPNADEVSGVYIMDYGNPKEAADSGWVTDRDVVERTVEAHQKSVHELPLLRKMIGYRLTGRPPAAGDERVFQQYVYYHLNNGEIVTRTYYLTADMSERYGWMELRRDELNILSDYEALQHPDKVKNIQLYYQKRTADYNNSIGQDLPIITKPDEIASVIQEMKKDIVNISLESQANAFGGDYSAADVNAAGYISVSMDLDVPDRQAVRTVSGTGIYTPLPQSSYGVHLSMYENTLKWLQEHGYMK